MMRQEELRKGDWVYFITNDVPCQITEIYTTLDAKGKQMVSLSENGKRYCVKMDEVEPITLTPEILEHAGFETWHNSPHITCWRAYGENSEDDIEVDFNKNTFGAIKLRIDVVGTYLSTIMITTVHQLQHVFEDHDIDIKFTRI